jgi:hypothetical protein
VAPQPNALLAMRAGVSLALPRLALLAREHLLRAEQLDRLAVDRVGERDRPEDVLALLLAARAQLGGQRLEVLPVLGEVDLEHHVAAVTSRPWMARPALNVLVSNSVCDGCGCQNADSTSE